MDNPQNRTEAETAASKAGEGRWEQGSGQVNPGETKEQIEQNQRAAETDALGRDPSDTPGHTRNADGELITDSAQPEGKGHGEGEPEQRADQVSGPSGVQRPREVGGDQGGVYDPGRVGLEGDDDRNPSDPASYANPDDQRREGGTSRDEPDDGRR